MKYGIGYTYIDEMRKGHHDITQFSKAFEAAKDRLVATGTFSHDRYIQHSSNAVGRVGNAGGELAEKYVWCTNHYLGLNRHPAVVRATAEAIAKYGTGSGTSAMSGGRCELHVEIEDFLRDFLRKEEVILFPTGYTTNLGMLPTIVQKGDVIITDEENHASIIDGIKLSRRDKLVFKHNDLDDLERQLIAAEGKYKNKFVVLESVYSMSGDVAPLREIVALKRKYGFYLFVDEAHSFGFYGAGGRGLADELGVLEDVDFMTGTFSKSCASIGGFCTFSERFRTFVMYRSSSYIFQATFPPSAAATTLAALRLFSSDGGFAERLMAKNAYMRRALLKAGFDLGTSSSPVIPIFIPDFDKLKAFERELYRRGVFSVSITYPAVQIHEGRIRLIVNDSHSYEDIDATVGILAELAEKYEVYEGVMA